MKNTNEDRKLFWDTLNGLAENKKFPFLYGRGVFFMPAHGSGMQALRTRTGRRAIFAHGALPSVFGHEKSLRMISGLVVRPM